MVRKKCRGYVKDIIGKQFRYLIKILEIDSLKGNILNSSESNNKVSERFTYQLEC